MYYNTNDENGDELRDSWVKTAKQDELILQFFIDNPDQEFTPAEVKHMCRICCKNWPITSIRRAINTLTKQGNLAKTDNLRTGTYGKKTHTWKFVTNPNIT